MTSALEALKQSKSNFASLTKKLENTIEQPEKKNKYQDLKHDLRDTWDLEEIEIIPVIVGATGLVKKNLQEHLRNIPGQPQLPEIQLSAIKGTVSIIKRALGHFTK